MNEVIKQALSDVMTTLPGVIVAYDGKTATVKPALPKMLANGDTLQAPQIVNVPVHWLTGDSGSAVISVPLKTGDAVTLHFSCRSIENWLSGSDQAPDDPRQFDLTDCFCTPVMRPGVGLADTENVSVQYGGGSIKIAPSGDVTLDAPSFTINAPTTVNGLLTYTQGMIGSGAEGGTIKIDGDVEFSGGSVTHDGKDIGKTSRHTGVQPGSGTSGEVV